MAIAITKVKENLTQEDFRNMSQEDISAFLRSLMGKTKELTPEEKIQRQKELKTMSHSDLLKMVGLDESDIYKGANKSLIKLRALRNNDSDVSRTAPEVRSV